MSDEADRTSAGRLFQSRGAAVANDRSPTVTHRDRRTSRRLEVDEQRRPRRLVGKSQQPIFSYYMILSWSLRGRDACCRSDRKWRKPWCRAWCHSVVYAVDWKSPLVYHAKRLHLYSFTTHVGLPTTHWHANFNSFRRKCVTAKTLASVGDSIRDFVWADHWCGRTHLSREKLFSLQKLSDSVRF